jgi:drug/metabolite transporter (DMT)-like permease
MGAYDSLAGIMQTFAVNYITNSSTIVLVQQSAIPISMLISKITLQSVYTRPQYIGATVVLLGIVVVLIPTLFSKDASSTDANNSELSWILVLVVSCVPMCLSSVYKEKALGETEINIVYLNGWVLV